MTREEAIEVIEQDIPCEHDTDLIEALDMAIQALEQEPTKREIEREYLFQSLCEDFKKLQAENDDLRKRLEQQPCEDAISRKDIEEFKELMTDINGDTVYAVRMSDIRQLPSVKPQESKTGHWIRVNKDKLKCSKCEITHFIAQYPHGCIDWCPNCGAKMD